jgi:DnaK suppressor protein
MADTATTRHTHLREILLDRRRGLEDDVRRRIREGRADRAIDVPDELERTDSDLSGDVELSLIQMKAETMSRMDEALVRLEAGDYGCCSGCGVEISETRLRALPFAIRCKACEERREQGRADTRRLSSSHASFSPFER